MYQSFLLFKTFNGPVCEEMHLIIKWPSHICRHVTDNNSKAKIFSLWSQPVTNEVYILFWPVAPPTSDLPITKSGAIRLPGCQLPLRCSYVRFGTPMLDVNKPKKPHNFKQPRRCLWKMETKEKIEPRRQSCWFFSWTGRILLVWLL